MKNISTLMKKHDFKSLYELLEEENYKYTIDNFERNFKKYSSTDKFSYLIYLIARERNVENTLLICDFLMFTDTFFDDVHTVIYDFLCQGLQIFPDNTELLQWIVSIYEGHPDSPFTLSELAEIKMRLQN